MDFCGERVVLVERSSKSHADRQRLRGAEERMKLEIGRLRTLLGPLGIGI